MKRVLITGANSYVGTSVEKWLMKESKNYHVETLDMQNPSWVNFDFTKFDVVFHVAGIAHVSKKKSMEDLYYKVNRDLAIQTARKAKESGVRQFIFMSSMIIYGNDKPSGYRQHIDLSNYNPTSAYGKSKLEADLSIQELMNEKFIVLVIRAPIIYGPGCKGNFPKLQNFAKKTILIPTLKNRKSMIYIDNLSEFIKQAINRSLYGVCYPQNSEYMSTSKIMILTREYLSMKIVKTRVFNPLIIFLTYISKYIKKMYGNKSYNQNNSFYSDFDYNIVTSSDSIKKSI
ncbi:NAD-dependent epimerase/dehydratase family protein [Peloplasma aerotolerans]|uniref:NAD-dependent epimerase/dehydratase family protein n=1 Tax=Peloplasma aerotolerans TaxID=3044389 RepID=A0AAW6U344_9MOLU|nr:NAD-dependent epimerase/dehydratase family protein [Mariniplasma sp. M4Ah]MDI6452376.1 NAD-dependent epimerase/dehydratase family protein [Mariniplasma sp. M4Ah]